MKPTALITGILGQDGTFMAELLTSKGYTVHGVRRRTAQPHPNMRYLPQGVQLHDGDVTDLASLIAIQREVKPEEVYHLAAQSHVGRSFTEPITTAQVTGLGTLNMLEAVRISGIHSRIYVASTSELFGGVSPKPCSELTPFRPRSPYGAAKAYSHAIAVNYREAYRMHVSCGILFNHESERRPEEFVTRKITMGIRKVLDGREDCIRLGNLDAKRDWGFAGDYVMAMWQMLQQPHADDYVIGTGETHSIREFIDAALDAAGVDHADVPIRIDPALYRPAEVNVLVADPRKAQEKLGWRWECSFEDLVRRMVRHDCGDYMQTQAAGTINPTC